MPGLRSTRPRLSLIAVGAAALVTLVACGDEPASLTSAPTEGPAPVEAGGEEAAAPGAEASPEGTPGFTVEVTIDDEGTPEISVVVTEEGVATPVSGQATPVAAASPGVAATPALATPVAVVPTAATP